MYPPDAFASDAAQNGRVSNTMLSGVRILSAPAAGDFAFERATQQIGEAVSAAFLAPHRDNPTKMTPDHEPRDGHEAFLADIVTAGATLWLQT